jgi:hypothetical protein
MAVESIALVRVFLAENAPPLRVWLAPGTTRTLAQAVRKALPGDAIREEVPAVVPPPGPAILLATAADLSGPWRAALLDHAAAALPGRPVICGGSTDKDILLDAMNSWRVFHLLPERPSPAELRDALVRAHRACALDYATARCAEQLHERCEAQRALLAELKTTRERLLRAERLTTAAGFCRALSTRLRQHLERLRALETSLRTLPEDPRRAELIATAAQNVQAVDALLAGLIEKAEAVVGGPAPQHPSPPTPENR